MRLLEGWMVVCLVGELWEIDWVVVYLWEVGLMN
jgi:hypothetical protein